MCWARLAPWVRERHKGPCVSPRSCRVGAPGDAPSGLKNKTGEGNQERGRRPQPSLGLHEPDEQT